MSDDTFGDIEPDDLWDNESPAPEQVTYRIHELRRLFAQLADDDEGVVDFFDLHDEEQQAGLVVGEFTVAWINDHPLSEAPRLAEHLHEVQRFLSPDRIPVWASLTEDQRVVGAAIGAHIADWLGAEGSWR